MVEENYRQDTDTKLTLDVKLRLLHLSESSEMCLPSADRKDCVYITSNQLTAQIRAETMSRWNLS